MKKRYWGLFLAASLTLTSCGAPTAPSAFTPVPSSPGGAPAPLPESGIVVENKSPEGAKEPAGGPSEGTQNSQDGLVDGFYWVYFDGGRVCFDESGALLEEDRTYTSLYDLVTGTERYRVRARSEDTGRDDEYGNPVVQRYSALYGVDGTLLWDWEPVEYLSGPGGLVIRQEPREMWENPMELLQSGYQSALWDPASGKTVVQGASSLEELGDGHFLVCDVSGRALGVIDGAGNKTGGFPVSENYYYPSVGSGLIAADLHNPYGDDGGKDGRVFLLDQSFAVQMEGERISLSYVGLRGPYLLCRNGGEESVYSLPELKKLFSYDPDKASVTYFDGERMILRTGERRNPENPVRLALCDGSGGELSQKYQFLAPEERDAAGDDQPAQRFLGVSEETACLLDRDGAVLHSIHLPGLSSISSLGNGYYACEVRSTQTEGEERPPYDESTTALLGADFSVIVPPGTYSSIEAVVSWRERHLVSYELFQCARTVNGLYRYDLVNPGGRVVLDRVTSVGEAGPNRVAVVRGFSMGLVDWEGNWISRHSVYQDFSGSD